MLGALIVFSGCFGTGTTDGEGDDDGAVGTTVINNYYNNTTVIENTPEYLSAFGIVPYGGGGEHTLLSLNQSAGEGIMKHDFMTMYSYNSSHIGFTETIAGGTTYVYSDCGNMNFKDSWYAPSSNMNTQTPEWFAGAGLECTHELRYSPSNNAIDIWIDLIYERVPVTIE
jgi:hypothetical protein